MGRVLNEEQVARKNEYNRQRYAKLRELNIELAREKDRLKARNRRQKFRDDMREYDRLRYAQNREEIRAKRAADYAANVGGMRDKALVYQKRRFSESSMRYRIKVALNAARGRCKSRGLEFELTEADIGEPTHCAVTGLPLDMSRSFNDGNTFCPSLDRIDPKKGYIKGNVRVVIHAYNLAKHTGDDESVLTMARALVRKYGMKELI